MNTFRDILERYKNGTATAEEITVVQEELEKYETISDYLTDKFNEELPPMEEIPDVLSAKKIARKVNFRLFCTVLLTVLSIALLAAAVITGCNLYYYNPNQGIEPVYDGDGQLLIDMTAFTELHSPGYSTYWAKAWRDGPGSYQLRIRQQNLFAGKSENYSEQLTRGRVLGNDDDTPNDYWHFPVANAFGYREGNIARLDESGETSAAPAPEYLQWQMDALKKLPGSSQASVYVTFPQDISLEQFSELYGKWNEKLYFAYAAVASDSGYIPTTVGFSPDASGVVLENAPEQEFPYFQLLGHSETDAGQVSVWEQHLRSLLRYLSGRTQFINAMAAVNGINTNYYTNVLSYIDTNGINIYGILIQGDVEEVQTFLEQEPYLDFHVNAVRLSVLSAG